MVPKDECVQCGPVNYPPAHDLCDQTPPPESRDVFETPILFLKETNDRIRSEISAQGHHGAQLARCLQMIADNVNAIETLEAMRE